MVAKNYLLRLIGKICVGAISYQILTTLPAQANSFTFSGSSNGGEGTAEMTFDGIGTNNVTVTLDNTSSLFLDDGTEGNAPAITGFGFDGMDPLPDLVSWELQAYDADGNLVTIGGSNFSGGDWEMDTFMSGISLDFLPNSGEVKGGIYNPDATEGLAALPNFFSTAILSLNFDDAFTPDFSSEMSPFVRMQNVGEDGEGSLKLYGTENNQTFASSIPTAAAPEPYHWAGGLFALGLGWKFQQYKKKLKV
jgi:hypothetical protein